MEEQRKKENVRRNGKMVYLFRQYGRAGFSVQDIVSQEIYLFQTSTWIQHDLGKHE